MEQWVYTVTETALSADMLNVCQNKQSDSLLLGCSATATTCRCYEYYVQQRSTWHRHRPGRGKLYRLIYTDLFCQFTIWFTQMKNILALSSYQTALAYKVLTLGSLYFVNNYVQKNGIFSQSVSQSATPLVHFIQ